MHLCNWPAMIIPQINTMFWYLILSKVSLKALMKITTNKILTINKFCSVTDPYNCKYIHHINSETGITVVAIFHTKLEP